MTGILGPDKEKLVFIAKKDSEEPIRIEFLHHQDCCEWVRIEEVHGDLDDLLGSPILQAECVTQEDKYCSWTFYKFATIKGSVTVRWLGESNGYYSERVDVEIDGMDPKIYIQKQISKIAGLDLL